MTFHLAHGLKLIQETTGNEYLILVKVGKEMFF